MDDVRDKMKDLMKKATNPFSSSKFKGQGRVLGSATPSTTSSSSSAAAASNPRNPRHNQPSLPPSKPIPNSTLRSTPTPPDPNPPSEFSPFDPLISSSARKLPSASPAPAFQCPVCFRSFPSEASVEAHVDYCLSQDADAAAISIDRDDSDVAARVAEFLSAEPKEGSVEVVIKLLGNVIREPGNDKFRRIRMGNPKIKEAVGDAKGGVEILKSVGFSLGEIGGEVWATIDEPSEQRVSVIRQAVLLLERWKAKDSAPPEIEVAFVTEEKPVVPEKIDRQVCVFFSVPENEAAKINLPDSFYNLSAEELKREFDQRKKRLEESRLLIPKSYKEKQAIAARRKYKRAVIRIQFPDGVVLQGVFLPWELTTDLYEFVSSALKEPSLEFELLRPAAPKLRLIPHFPQRGERAKTLEEEDLVPSALLKFKPIETDSILFTGLNNELLEAYQTTLQ